MNVYIGVSWRGIVNAMKENGRCKLNCVSMRGSRYKSAMRAIWSEYRDASKR